MNRRRRRPLKLHLRATPGPRVVLRSSPKLSFKIILTAVLLALIVAAALGFAAVAFVKSARLKHQGNAASPSPSATALVAGTVNPAPTTIASTPPPLVSATPAPSLAATPVLRPKALVQSGTPQPAKTPSEGARKSAEQRRREAERKRSRLEAQHKNHQISDEAYKEGQKEYQEEMAKYRDVVGGAASANRAQ
jgi:hypothetical protein